MLEYFRFVKNYNMLVLHFLKGNYFSEAKLVIENNDIEIDINYAFQLVVENGNLDLTKFGTNYQVNDNYIAKEAYQHAYDKMIKFLREKNVPPK